MGFDWEHEATKEGGDYAEPLPAGVHDVEVTRVLFGSKGGGPFKSRAGDAQIMLIFADREGRECAQMVTLSEKAGWVLARLLSAAGANLARMKEDGVEPKDFADERLANANLVGRRLRIEVKYSAGADGKEYADVTPVRQKPGAPEPPERPERQGINPDDVPY